MPVVWPASGRKKKGRRSKFCALVASSENFEERKACRKRQFVEPFEMHALVYSHCPARCHAMTAAHFCWPCKYSPTHPTPTAMAKIVAVAAFKGNITYKTLLPSQCAFSELDILRYKGVFKYIYLIFKINIFDVEHSCRMNRKSSEHNTSGGMQLRLQSCFFAEPNNFKSDSASFFALAKYCRSSAWI